MNRVRELLVKINQALQDGTATAADITALRQAYFEPEPGGRDTALDGAFETIADALQLCIAQRQSRDAEARRLIREATEPEPTVDGIPAPSTVGQPGHLSHGFFCGCDDCRH